MEDMVICGGKRTCACHKQHLTSSAANCAYTLNDSLHIGDSLSVWKKEWLLLCGSWQQMLSIEPCLHCLELDGLLYVSQSSRPVMLLQNTCFLDMFISLQVTASGILLQILKPARNLHKLLVPLMELIFLSFAPQRVPLTITIGKDTIPS